MEFFNKHKSLLLVSFAIGFVSALFFRFSPLVFTSDFERVDRNSTSLQQEAHKRSLENLGKEVFGMGGLPVSPFADCVVRPAGGEPGFLSPTPKCNKYSLFGEFAIFINTLFWGLLVFIVLIPLEIFRRKILRV
jgi:hypothetical protein